MAVRIPDTVRTAPAPTVNSPHMSNVLSGLKNSLRSMGRSMSDKRKADLYRELHLLISSGVDPSTVFEVLANARAGDRSRDLFLAVRASLGRGRTLSGALADQGLFSRYEEQSIQVGEETGRLAEVLSELADHFTAKVKLKRTLASAFAYPGFVLFVTCGVVGFMLRVVVPMFSEVFKRSGAELPAITRTVMNLSAYSGPFILAAVLVLLALAVLFYFFKEHPTLQRASAWTVLHAPLIGPIYRKAQFARFYRAMASMLSAQVPLDRALALATDLVDLHPLRIAIADIRERVMRGGHLHEACKAHRLFDPKDVAMIAVAEEVRQLDRMFMRLAEERTNEVQHRTSLMGSVLEPVMIVFIAVFVGVILVAMYLPMFKLSTAF
jgi:type IV pilus assembly protein PilC